MPESHMCIQMVGVFLPYICVPEEEILFYSDSQLPFTFVKQFPRKACLKQKVGCFMKRIIEPRPHVYE